MRGVTNSEQLIALARRLVACPHFRWLPGMAGLYFEPGRQVDCRVFAVFGAVDVVEDVLVWSFPDDARPDLSDPATRGCVLQLVRDAWHRQGLSALNIGNGWRVGDGIGWAGPACDTEIEALVAALEAAPPR